MRTFSILNMKGGVGKTTIAINLSYVLATVYRQRVLLVDADGQANATRALLPGDGYDGLTDLLSGNIACYDEIVEPTEIRDLEMIPASNSLWKIDLSCVMHSGCGTLSVLRNMRDAIEEDGTYDVMIIDCPPSFSGACAAAIAASNSIIIPALPDAFSAEGMEDLVAQINGVRTIQPDVRIAGCLVNQFHRSDVVLDAVEYLREAAPIPVFDTVIRRTDKVLESTWAHQPVLLWSPRSSAARDMRAWVRELVTKEALLNGR